MARYLQMLTQKTPSGEAIDRLWKGSIDIHIHFAPDPGTRRRWDGYTTAEEASKAGMRGVVLKSHHIPSIQTAYAVQKLIPDVLVCGSICLDENMGGLTRVGLKSLIDNAKMGCKVVWFPLESRFSHVLRPELAGTGAFILDGNGKLLPIIDEFLHVIKEYDMLLCNGHLSYEESVVLFDHAKKAGIDKMVATHPFYDCLWNPYTMDQVKSLADMGVFIEHCYRECLPLSGSHDPMQYVEAIELCGAEHTILSTDHAQITDDSPAEGMRAFIAMMLQLGVSESDLELMVKKNPAYLLGLPYPVPDDEDFSKSKEW